MDAKEKVKGAVLEALNQCVLKGFILSQDACPVKTGFLKGSGSYIKMAEGAKVLYSAPYSSTIEHGRAEGVEVVKGHHVKSHYVKGYTRHVKAKEGSHFIENSLKRSFADLSNELDSFLRASFNNVKRR